MKEKHLLELERHLTKAFTEILTTTSIHELRKIDWLSSNPDFYIEQDQQKIAA
ncbi:hypothetical protein [methanotrophic endosymbiont of Bathymodiolus puteoserpentis (Logatchev)]|jgi:hypothetical protein|uniref:hypothetical protein n=1 Tax=methanotrophic endosymbiont of Bathymodiolus puteoserpentis (Logatchev) TaxID=343235 RepID=UPI0013C7D581|nr:hypothetical protein [methanotrophic endosymbiont of Bathymodiolus puteoserpentis (Logatchev)]SHE20174.1 hypothetical protein BPUTEOMOX_2797 [methanotrophic endosymbiont of Bathymodiolus puteoserpentis (Logatchev)]